MSVLAFLALAVWVGLMARAAYYVVRPRGERITAWVPLAPAAVPHR
jgi:hypothetical protein